MSDLIDRQDAIDAIHKDILFKPLDNQSFYRENHEFVTVGYVERILLAVPSAEPRCIANIQISQEQLDEAFEKVKADILSVKQKTGKWLIAEKDRYFVHSVRCSVCGYCISWMAHYCPNCGVKMKGEADE